MKSYTGKKCKTGRSPTPSVLDSICPVYPMLPVSLDCPLFIAPSEFSNVYLSIMKRKFKQWWPTIPPISTKKTITSHPNWTHWTKKKDHDIWRWNSTSGLGTDSTFVLGTDSTSWLGTNSTSWLGTDYTSWLGTDTTSWLGTDTTSWLGTDSKLLNG